MKKELIDSSKEFNDDWDKVSQYIMKTYEKEFHHFPNSIDLVVSDGSQRIEIHL
ncbi:hypothetical protein [Companilactobacillus bobalius]|uniref:Uncharacterized protein n=3 Tax=Companilactobacillus TaxID=2767879 RepID=A0A202F5T9_9LACO|nr:hypothetical protein [Companilactobacillus bobalius]KRK85029.1 hypothetical protein FC78_GL000830 [Companilactobacillus bobalius DSM 19674]OVE95817.1 hypothetical protein LKACC16343_02569 [Companilactobacillus bobalius]GEO59329.1 hypothetical protein LBO01_24580 [Companilactobacillus paralimentarius]HIY92383.1 hypothetical protein [Candidatus Companilactobacillus pullicola]